MFVRNKIFFFKQKYPYKQEVKTELYLTNLPIEENFKIVLTAVKKGKIVKKWSKRQEKM